MHEPILPEYHGWWRITETSQWDRVGRCGIFDHNTKRLAPLSVNELPSGDWLSR